jgi:hypothetical protein
MTQYGSSQPEPQDPRYGPGYEQQQPGYGSGQHPQQPPKKKRHIFRWVFLAIQVLFLIWIIAGASSASDNCEGETGQALEACEAGTAVGAGIGVVLIIFIWMAVDVILALTYLVFVRGRRR